MPQPVALLVNPSAGGGRALRVLPAVEAELNRLGVPVRVQRTRSLEHGRTLAVAAAARGDVVATLSGDGLVGAVAGALRGRDGAVMGVLPGGRGNDFARAIGVPADPVEACAVLAFGQPRPVDVGEAVPDGGGEPRTFVGIASVGFDSEANRVANGAPSWLGHFVYAYGALRVLVRWRPVRFAVTVDGRDCSFTGYTVAVANGTAYGGGMLMAPDARLDDGRLDAMLIAPRTKHEGLRMLHRVFHGTHVVMPSVTPRRGAEVRVAADRSFTVYADGDPLADLPVTLRAVPGAIRVLLPA